MKPRANKPSKKFRQSILLLCEGETEQAYLNGLKALRYNKTHIKILPELPKHSDYKHMFSIIKDILCSGQGENYLWMFCLLDMDTIYNQNMKTEYDSDKRKLLRIKDSSDRLLMIESRPCIEFWFLLHYDPKDRLLNNCKEATAALCKHLPDYCKEKKYTETLYKRLIDRLDIAISNSKAICRKQRNHGVEHSYTLMHEVFETLDTLADK